MMPMWKRHALRYSTTGPEQPIATLFVQPPASETSSADLIQNLVRDESG